MLLFTHLEDDSRVITSVHKSINKEKHRCIKPPISVLAVKIYFINKSKVIIENGANTDAYAGIEGKKAERMAIMTFGYDRHQSNYLPAFFCKRKIPKTNFWPLCA